MLTRRSALAATAGLLAAPAVGPKRVHAATPARDTVVGVVPFVPQLNNAIASGLGPGIPGTQIFAGLLELDDHFNPVPYLAEGWTTAPDNLSVTFKLRGGAKFHDGTPITSHDVAFSLELVKNNHPFGRSMFGPVATVETPDPLTARIVLAQHHPALMASLTTLLMPVLPRHVYSVGPIRSNPANLKPVGSGPFRLLEFHHGQVVLLERNPDFFLPGRPRTERLALRIIPDQETAVLALERGEVDMALHASFSARNFDRLRRNPHMEVVNKGFAGLGIVDYLEFNLRRKPYSDVRVRHAIAHAINRPFIVNKLLDGYATPLEGPLPPDSPFATTDLQRYPYDLAQARALLDEAGLKPGHDGVRFHMTLDAPVFSGDYLAHVADYLRPQLQQIGIAVRRRASPDDGTWMTRISNYDYEATMSSIYNYPDPVIGTNRLFLSTNQIKGVMFTNTSGYSNPEVDRLLNAGAIEPDVAKRKALYAQFQKIETQDLPLIHTTVEQPQRVTNRSLRGLPKTVLGAMTPLLDLHKA